MYPGVRSSTRMSERSARARTMSRPSAESRSMTDAALAAVGVDEAEAALRARLVAGEGRHATGGVALGRLHLDDVCAKVAQGAGAHLAQAVGEVENAEVVKGCGRAAIGSWVVLLVRRGVKQDP